jgi:hypothetical protein
VDGDQDFSAAHPVSEYNLTFKTWAAPGEKNINGQDPLFVNASQRNFRLQRGSPAIGAGRDGATIGALDYPNVYYVDPRHPAATDEPGWGYPAVPLATLTKACAVAKPGETILLREGVYREALRPTSDGVTFRGLKGERVMLSGADLIEGWKREPDYSWSAPLASSPRKVLRDGRQWDEFRFDAAAKRIVVRGRDPRLHLIENVVRERAIELGASRLKIENVASTDTLNHAK